FVIVFSTYYPDFFNFNKCFAINPSELANDIHQSWWHVLRLISALFLHGSWQHWAGNMVLFLIIALSLERRVGSFWFLIIYFVSGFAGNIASLYQLGQSSYYLLGASGALSGLLGAWLLLYPKQNISVIIPIGLYLQKAKIPILLLAFTWLGLQIVLQLVGNQEDPIVWVSHIVGFIIGFFVAWLYRIVT
ncbi:MAG: rhomboid family intramembrane serine protease, partial [Marinicellaceae bacterium]